MSKPHCSPSSRQHPALAALVGCFVLACGDISSDPSPYPEADAQDVDGWLLADANARLSQVEGIRGLLVARNGVLILEEYFSGVGPDSTMGVRSVTKSFTSALIGIAIQEGYIGSTDDTLGEYLIPTVVDSLAPEKAAITVRQLLTMSAGIDWAQGRRGPDFGDWYLSDDHVQYVLDKPLVDPPGTRFAYSDGMAHLLSVVLTEAAGQNTDEFASEHLFDPTGIGERTWFRGNRGYNFGGVRLHLSLRHMWTFGELYLNSGFANGHQVVPAGWIEQSTRSHISTDGYSPFGPGYGYLWWIGEGAPHEFFFANGYGGQFIVVVPETRMVVATQCQPSGFTRDEAEMHWFEILSTVVEEVIPAAQ